MGRGENNLCVILVFAINTVLEFLRMENSDKNSIPRDHRGYFVFKFHDLMYAIVIQLPTIGLRFVCYL